MSLIGDFSDYKVFIRPGYTDMRKAINGLSEVVVSIMEKDPFSKCLFFFTNRGRKILKCIYWDKTGFCLWQKKLEKEKFPWPQTEEQAKEIDLDQLSLLLQGIDFWKAHQELKYENIH